MCSQNVNRPPDSVDIFTRFLPESMRYNSLVLMDDGRYLMEWHVKVGKYNHIASVIFGEFITFSFLKAHTERDVAASYYGSQPYLDEMLKDLAVCVAIFIEHKTVNNNKSILQKSVKKLKNFDKDDGGVDVKNV